MRSKGRTGNKTDEIADRICSINACVHNKRLGDPLGSQPEEKRKMNEKSVLGRIPGRAIGLMMGIMVFAGIFIASARDLYASTFYPLYVGGVQFSSDNLVINQSDKTDFSGKAEYDPGTNTLTLTDFNNGGWTYRKVEGTLGSSIGIYYTGETDLNIVLVGDNIITCNLTGDESKKYYNKSGLASEGDAAVTITGDSLTVESGDSIDYQGSVAYLDGIYVNNKLVINGGNITVRGGDCKQKYSYGIRVGYSGSNPPGTLVVNDGYVKAEAGNITGDYTNAESYGISASGYVYVYGGIVEATGGDTFSGRSKGIYSEYMAWFEGGRTTAKAGTGPDTSYGIGGHTSVKEDAIFMASGHTKAAYPFILHYAPGWGWDDVEGTGVRTDLPAYTSGSGESYAYKKIRFPNKYSVTVINGSGSGLYHENDTVTIKADPPEKGKAFFKWVRDDGRVLTDERSAATTFIMPSQDVTVTAVYKDVDDDGSDAPVDKVPIGRTKPANTFVGGQKVDVKSLYFSNHPEATRFQSSSKKIASVSKKGLMKAKKPGTVTIEAQTGKKKAERKTVSSCSLIILEKPKLKFKVKYSAATDIGKVLDGYEFFTTASTKQTAADYWESSKPAVAEVNPETGVITIKGKGTTTITAYFGKKGEKGTLKVKAKLKVKK